MEFISSLFTRKKKPLSSTGFNMPAGNNGYFNSVNPKNIPANIQQKTANLISSYKSRNLGLYTSLKGQLRDYVKTNPVAGPVFIEQRISRSHSDTSALTDEDLEEMKEQILNSQLGGRRRRNGKKTRSNRKNRKTQRRRRN